MMPITTSLMRYTAISARIDAACQPWRRRKSPKTSNTTPPTHLAARREAGRSLLARGIPERARPGPDHRQAVADLVAGGQRRLALGAGRFDAQGIERNVLRGRAE